ncbi:MAG: hypothetical protein ACRD8O_05875 [Bryobacteraceae bacterium]
MAGASRATVSLGSRPATAQGADPNGKDGLGDTPLHWAKRRGNAVIVELLKSKGAEAPSLRDKIYAAPSGVPDARTAVERSVTLLQKVGQPVVKKFACISCHNQTLPAMAAAMARARGLKLDETAAALNIKTIL